MKISVITVTLNNLSGLKETVRSVERQTFLDFEYIVVDGASTDGSKEYIRGVNRIDKWVSEPDRGIYNAMNKAVTMAQGEYCIFMNAGDFFYDCEVLEHVASQLQGADFYVGITKIVYDSYTKLKPAPEQPLTMRFMVTDMPCHQSTFTRTTILKNSPYREDLRIVSDWEKFFHYWFCRQATYVPLQTVVSVFRVDGYSYMNENKIPEEREIVLRELLPERITCYCLHKQGIEKKIDAALNKPPLKRDWKLIRNAFKYLIKDIFVALKP